MEQSSPFKNKDFLLILTKQKDILLLFYYDFILTGKILFTIRKNKGNLNNFKLFLSIIWKAFLNERSLS
jgi:hypothetical protein